MRQVLKLPRFQIQTPSPIFLVKSAVIIIKKKYFKQLCNKAIYARSKKFHFQQRALHRFISFTETLYIL